MTLVMGISNWGVGFAVDNLGLTSNEVAFWMAGLVVLPGLSWAGFLTLSQKQLQQGQCKASTYHIDPSGFNPRPMVREEQIENKTQPGEK